MTPENMPSPPEPKSAHSALRPPDFLLPKADKIAGRKREGEPDVYVSWGGQVYGPSSVEDVISGVRTSYFEEDALFWFEGREQWRPVAELPALIDESGAAGLPTEARHHPTPSEGITPAWPGGRKSSSSGRERRRRRPQGKRAQKKTRAQVGGRLIVIGAVLLAVVLTAGLLLLMSLA